MPVKFLTEPVQWKSFDDNTVDTYVGLPGEPVIDRRGGTPEIRIHDGVTVGGRRVGEGALVTVSVPSITSPLNGATGVGFSPIITGSSFSYTSNGNTLTHYSSHWQVSAVSDFSTTVYDSGDTLSSLTSLDLSAKSVTLDPETTYYVRVRYKASNGALSSWSNAISFTTRSATVQGTETAKLTASDGAANDYFGSSVSISGDGNTAVISAYMDGDNGPGSGSAYIFTRSGSAWTQQAKLLASDGAAGDYFGYSVSISGDGNTAIISAPDSTVNGEVQAGSVYVFTRSGNTWTQETKLISPNNWQYDRFGLSVSISSDGNAIVIGAPYNDQDKGGVYIFSRSGSTWTSTQVILPGNAIGSSRFGRSVAISGDGNTFVAGAPTDNNTKGAIFIFTKTNGTWGQLTKISSPINQYNDSFGWSVAISEDGNYIAALSRVDSNARQKVYIYHNNAGTWTQQAVLMSSLSAAQLNDSFGMSLSFNADGSLLFTGDNSIDQVKGSAYLFRRTGSSWTEQLNMSASDGEMEDAFGASVSLSSDGKTAIVGSCYDDDNGTDSGSVYVFE